MTLHETLGKVLAALHLGCILGRAYYGNGCESLVCLKVVIDTVYQRILRAYNNHVNLLVQDKSLDGVKIVGLDGYVLTYVCGTGVARCDVKLVKLWALGNLPGQSMLTASASK